MNYLKLAKLRNNPTNMNITKPHIIISNIGNNITQKPKKAIGRVGDK